MKKEMISSKTQVSIWATFIIIFALLLPTTSFAQGGSPPPKPILELEKRQSADERLRAYGTNLLGDGIDSHTGSISFMQTDVSLPGNFPLEVAIRRKRSQGLFYAQNYHVEFGDWQIDVPRIYVTTPRQDAWTGQRCSTDFSTGFPNLYYSGTLWQRHQYSNGVIMDVPNASGQQVLQSPQGSQWPSGATHVTVSGWYFTCTTASDGGQGFYAYSPDGTRYKFDRYIVHEGDHLGSIAIGGGPTLARDVNVLAATEVRDVNGNTVMYTYDNNDRLTKILASDGREIDLSYSNNLISQITANPGTNDARSWTYTYSTQSYPEIIEGTINRANTLTKVTQPDGKYWTFNIVGMDAKPGFGDLCTQITQNISLTHPYGVVGAFVLNETKHRTSFNVQDQIVLGSCPNEDFDPPDVPFPPTYRLRVAKILSVASKTLNGPNLASHNWNYAYETDTGPSGSSSSDRTNWTVITAPNGVRTKSFHMWNGEPQGGKLVKEQILDAASSAVIRTKDITYMQEAMVGNSLVGTGTTSRTTTQPTHTASMVTTQDGDTYTSKSSYNTDGNSTDYSYGFPTQTQSYSSVTTSPRITDTTYKHNKTKWILGLPGSVDVNSRNTATYTYDSLGQKIAQTRYGAAYATFNYNSNGTINWIKDAENRQTTALDWKRGNPQRILRPDNTNVYQYVDHNGWLTSTITAKGDTTAYNHDNMGRLTLVDRPIQSSTTIAYNFTGAPVQTITRGTRVDTITYDSLFRPTLVNTGSQMYSKTSYDSAGRTSFQSFPSASSNPTVGTTMTYDGLGRIRKQTTPDGTTHHNYLSYHRHLTIDPSGRSTIRYDYGWDGPNSGNTRAIYNYANSTYLRNTYIYTNVWGETTRVRQWGDLNGHTVDENRYYYYDTQGRMCRYRTEEAGDTVYEYDASGQLTAYATGLSNGSACTTPSGNNKVALTRDAVGRVTLTNYTDSNTPDINTTYDDNGNVLTLNRGGANWTYVYNALDALTSESLAIDGKTFGLGYSYTNDGYLASRTLPGGASLNYAHDALGRETSVKNGTSNIATNIGYHSSGAASGLTYGNGQVYLKTLNVMQRPQQVKVSKPGTTAFDRSYAYDATGLITSITDATDAAHNQAFTYDGLGQLATANGSWGSGSFDYDSLGNIREKDFSNWLGGTRTVAMSYNAQNRLASYTDSTGPNKTFGYDNRGNISAWGNLSLVYDSADQPRSISGTPDYVCPPKPAVCIPPAPVNATYTYDGNLKRVKSVVGGKTMYNVYDASRTLVHVDNITDAEATDYVKGAGMSLARIKNGTSVTYLHNDHLGSTASATDTGGAVQWTERYSPFGELLSGNAANDNLAAFTGHIRDTATGLTYMQARYYDPVVGRFLSVDPVTFMDTGNPNFFNRYRYCANNPVNCSDPTGMTDVFIGGAEDDQTENVKNAHDQYAKDNPGRTTAYFGHNQRKEATAFIKSEHAKQTEDGGTAEPINIIGHSYGAKTATQVSRDVGKAGLEVDNLVGIDGVNTIFSNTNAGSTVQNTISVNGKGSGKRNGSNLTEAAGKFKARVTLQGGRPQAFRNGVAHTYKTMTADHSDFSGMFAAGAKAAIDESYNTP